MPFDNVSENEALIRAAEAEIQYWCEQKNLTRPFLDVSPDSSALETHIMVSAIVAVAAGVLIIAVRIWLGIDIFGVPSNHFGLPSKEEESFREIFGMKWLKMDQTWLASKYGPVGMQYLIFQRHVLLLVTIVCVAATVIIAPVNYHNGQKFSNFTDKITVSNLSPESPWMWLHIGLAVLIVPCAVLIMKRYLTVVAPSVYDLATNRVLIFEHLPEELRGQNLLRWLANKYPWCKVSRMYKTFPTRRLFDLQSKVDVLTQIYKNCQPEETLRWTRRNTAAEDYYKEKLDRAHEDLNHEVVASQMEPLDTAFVVLKTRKMAKEVCEFESNELIADERIQVTIAPAVADIEWRNMDNRKQTLLKRWLFCIFLLFFMFFFTTPQYLVYQVDEKLNGTLAGKQSVPTIYWFLSPSLLYGVSKLLHFIMFASISHLGYYRQSNINYAILLQTGFYLVLAIVVVPSIAFGPIFTYIKISLSETPFDAVRNATTTYWKCNFTPQSTFFFVSYLISSCLVGTVFDYLRGFGLLALLGTFFTSKSWTEIRVLATQESQFGLGEEYGWIILHVAITVSMAVANPLVVPIGLLYLLLKHAVDSVVLLHCRVAVTNVGPRFHVLAASMVVYCTVLLQLSNAMFLNIQTQQKSAFVAGFLAMLSPVLLLAHSHSAWLWTEPARPPPKRQRPDIYKPAMQIKPRDRSERDLDVSSDSDDEC